MAEIPKAKRPGGRPPLESKPDTWFAEMPPPAARQTSAGRMPPPAARQTSAERMPVPVAVPKTGQVNMSTADPMEHLKFDPNSVSDVAKAINIEPMKIGEFDVWPIQQVVGKTVMEIEGITQYKAPTGGGKTLTGIVAALESERCIITVPPGVHGTWITALKKAGLFTIDPTTTRIFDYSNTNKHIEYLDGITEDPTQWGDGPLVVLSKRSHLKNTVDLFDAVGYGDNASIIIDEAHTDAKALQDYIYSRYTGGNFKRMVLLSGSDIDYSKIGLKKARLTIDTIISTTITGHMPDDVWQYTFLDPNPIVRGVLDEEWREAMNDVIAKHKKPIISATKEVFSLLVGDAPRRRAQVYMGKHIVRFESSSKVTETSETSESKFNNTYNTAIAFIDKGKTSGLNLHGDAIIIANTGTLSNISLVQLIARPLRHDNPFPKVNYYSFCTDTESFLRSYYAWAFYHHDWPWGSDPDINSGMVHKGIAVIKALGAKPDEIDRTDACIILANYPLMLKDGHGPDGDKTLYTSELFDQVADWWNAHKTERTVLTEDLISDIIW